MKKISIIILSVFVIACLATLVAGSSPKATSIEGRPVATELSLTAPDAGEVPIRETKKSYGLCSTSIFGMWNPSEADLDPYRSTDYYLYDNLVPENAEGRLPFELHTQKYTYVIDAYEPEEQELGMAWLKLENATTGEAIAFKYSPASYARLCYSSSLGEITLADVEEVVTLRALPVHLDQGELTPFDPEEDEVFYQEGVGTAETNTADWDPGWGVF